MKKWIALLLVLVMCLALCACAGKAKEEQKAEPQESAQPADTEDTGVTSGSDLEPTEPLVSSDSDLQP